MCPRNMFICGTQLNEENQYFPVKNYKHKRPICTVCKYGNEEYKSIIFVPSVIVTPGAVITSDDIPNDTVEIIFPFDDEHNPNKDIFNEKMIRMLIRYYPDTSQVRSVILMDSGNM